MLANELRRIVDFDQDLLEVAGTSAGIYSVPNPCNWVNWINETAKISYLLVNPADLLDNEALQFNSSRWTAEAPVTFDPLNGKFSIVGTSDTTLNVNRRKEDLVVGQQYRVTFTIDAIDDATVNLELGTALGTERTTAATFSEIITCAGNGRLTFDIVLADGVGDSVTVSGLSVVALPDAVEGEYDYAVADGATQELTEGGRRPVRGVSVWAPTDAVVGTKSLRGQFLSRRAGG